MLCLHRLLKIKRTREIHGDVGHLRMVRVTAEKNYILSFSSFWSDARHSRSRSFKTIIQDNWPAGLVWNRKKNTCSTKRYVDFIVIIKLQCTCYYMYYMQITCTTCTHTYFTHGLFHKFVVIDFGFVSKITGLLHIRWMMFGKRTPLFTLRSYCYSCSAPSMP